jgi:hypothetical protein
MRVVVLSAFALATIISVGALPAPPAADYQRDKQSAPAGRIIQDPSSPTSSPNAPLPSQSPIQVAEPPPALAARDELEAEPPVAQPAPTPGYVHAFHKVSKSEDHVQPQAHAAHSQYQSKTNQNGESASNTATPKENKDHLAGHNGHDTVRGEHEKEQDVQDLVEDGGDNIHPQDAVVATPGHTPPANKLSELSASSVGLEDADAETKDVETFGDSAHFSKFASNFLATRRKRESIRMSHLLRIPHLTRRSSNNPRSSPPTANRHHTVRSLSSPVLPLTHA